VGLNNLGSGSRYIPNRVIEIYRSESQKVENPYDFGLLHNISLDIHHSLFRENWIDFQEYLQDSKNNMRRYVSSVELCVSGTFLTENNEPLIKKIQPIFHMIQITYLDIECDQITISMLIKILYALENLNSIQISNSPLHEQIPLKTQDKKMLKKYLNINKIMKITLRHVTDREQIDFIFERFPRIQFFGLERVQDVNLEPMAVCLLSNIINNNISHPMTICIFCDDAKYNKVKILYRMIDASNLFKNYTIYRQYDRFYIQWNGNDLI